MVQSYQSPFEIVYNTTAQGVPISVLIENESHVILDSKIILAQIPDAFHHVNISGMTEKSFNQVLSLTTHYKVDYNAGVVYFHTSLEGTSVTIASYYGRGFKRIFAERVKISDDDNYYNAIEAEGAFKEIYEKADDIQEQVTNLSFTGSEHDALVTASLIDTEGENFGVGGNETYLNGRLDKWENKLSSSMAETVNVKNYGAVGNGIANDTFAIQSAINYAYTTGKIVIVPPGIYKIDPISFPAARIVGNTTSSFDRSKGSVFVCTSNEAMFSNTTNSGFLRLEYLYLEAPNPVKWSWSDATSNGLFFQAHNCLFDAVTLTINKTAVELKQCDFVDISTCTFFNYNIGILVHQSFWVDERDSTQVNIVNINMHNHNVGIRLKQCDKVLLEAVDISGCNTGIEFYESNQRVTLINCHVEDYGKYVAGYGYFIPDDFLQNNLTLINCSTLLAGSYGVAGFYQGKSTEHILSTTIQNCHFDYNPDIAGHKALIALSKLIIIGDLPNSNPLSMVFTRWDCHNNDTIIMTSKNAITAGGNLLPFNKILAKEQLYYQSGPANIVINNAPNSIINGAREIVFTTNESTWLYRTITLKQGWHTLIYNAYSTTGAVQFYLQQAEEPWNDLIVSLVTNNGEICIRRVVFYMEETTWCNFGIHSNINSNMIIGCIELYEGFRSEFSGTEQLPKLSAPPTTGYFLMGDRIVQSTPEIGQPKAWVCVETGSPGTWVSEGNL